VATEIKKPVSIFKDLLGLASTSRTVQLAIVLLVIAAIAAAVFVQKISRHVETVEAEKLAQQKAAADKSSFENSLFRFRETQDLQDVIALGADLSQVPKPFQSVFHNHVEKLVASQSGTARIMPDVLLPAFYSDGYFEAVNAGDLKILDSTQFFSRIPRLLTVTPQASFSDSTSVRGMRTCHLLITVRMLQPGGDPRETVQIKATGAGFSDGASLDKAFQSIPADQLDELKNLLL